MFEDRPDLEAPRDRLFGLIAATPRLDWLILTKRPEVAARYFRPGNQWGAVEAYRDLVYGEDSDVSLGDGFAMWPPRNVWLGTSVEDQKRADERIPVLAGIPAAVRFLSVEPLLSDIWFPSLGNIDWVIVGGESGHGARPCGLGWIRSIRDQCRAAEVPLFVKQLGSRPRHLGIGLKDVASGRYLQPIRRELNLRDPKGGDIDEFPEDLRIREFPTPRT